ncbi:hypothetical protein FF38_13616 [Lucilia cuprina]|uniref:Uncharacterized protein n=1 Tax=Lucilia cuprina TaxID=7375 RepID=A0A0L0C9P1_LUCCU|nr:hypothetical protein CVS40_12312 [Lucilia cuprina]KNC29153.1 hypothetical protein FF38_13616 [Lucilia cuprina]
MKLFQVIFAISCVIALAMANPGHNIIKGDNNGGNKQSNADASFSLWG